MEKTAGYCIACNAAGDNGNQDGNTEMLDMNEFNDDMITVNKVPRGKREARFRLR